ncbi:MAG: isocitrate/isopropylmalate dehydrogenase family protein [Chloroflexota bacterium]|nr:isocitrate/isopropylmalate dehydrogenase family protein [Chloroflexota bacterium]MDE2854662.1 isocitrate/isopropylmalate dehydrogenase family protein [Chloroflexota bacterium]MDE2946055.1 isocitrate/isopropylmalate dehydrogenase family protein [Chloroflexota bacterium]
MKLCVVEGDGIGREVVPAAVRVLRQVVPELEVIRAEAGWDRFQKTGEALPEDTVARAKEAQAVLFGACSSPSYPVAGYSSPIVSLRKKMETFANLRPTRFLPVPTARAGVDLVVVRENTEDLYIGDERTADAGDTGTATKRITRQASERIAHTAFRLARNEKRRRVTIVHKGNVLPKTDGLFRRVAYEVSKQYSDIETDELLVDTAAYWMVKEPSRFDVVLTPNLYGDILSDMAAAWGGGLGLAPALNIGNQVAVAEPVHGSAPDIAGRDVANPTAAILSAAMLVRHHWNKPELADKIDAAVSDTLSKGDYTADILGARGISTTEFANIICERLG